MSASVKTMENRWLRGGRNRGKNLFVGSVLTPLMLYMMFWILLPMIFAVVLAFFDYSPARTGGPILDLGGNNPFTGLGHFQKMLGDSLDARLFRNGLKTTLTFTALVVPLSLAITLPLAVAIEAVHERLKVVFRFVYFLPTVMTSVAVGLMWTYFYHPQRGLFNEILKVVGLPPQIWLSDPRAFLLGVPLALWAVSITYLWRGFGYNLIIFIAGLQGIPGELKEAAIVDGANAWQRFWRITLPLLQPTLLFVLVMTVLSSFQAFDIIQVMSRTGSGAVIPATRVLMLDIYLNAFRHYSMGWAGAESVVLFLIILTVTIAQMRLLRTRWEY